MNKLFFFAFFYVAPVFSFQPENPLLFPKSTTQNPTPLEHTRFEKCINTIADSVGDKNYLEMLSEMSINNDLKTYELNFLMNADDFVSIYAYARDFYEPVNIALKKGDQKTYLCYTRHLDLALKKLPDFKGLVFRGSKLSLQQALKFFPNQVIRDPTYVSSSYGDLAANYSTRPVILKIISKHGKKIEELTVVKSEEKEVLFLRNTKFKIIRRPQKINKSQILIEMEEVD